MRILAALGIFGSLYGQQIVEKTGLHREEVWRNLKVLVRKQIIKGEKVGRGKYYEPILSERTLDCIIYILDQGGLRKFLQKGRKYYQKMIKTSKLMLSVSKEAEKYENEIIELAVAREEPYIEILPHAMSWRKTKKEKARVNLKPSFHLPESRKMEIRKSITYPKKLHTRTATTTDGLQWEIRRLTLLEMIDIVRKLEKNNEQSQEETDPDVSALIEATVRLSL